MLNRNEKLRVLSVFIEHELEKLGTNEEFFKIPAADFGFLRMGTITPQYISINWVLGITDEGTENRYFIKYDRFNNEVCNVQTYNTPMPKDSFEAMCDTIKQAYKSVNVYLGCPYKLAS